MWCRGEDLAAGSWAAHPESTESAEGGEGVERTTPEPFAFGVDTGRTLRTASRFDLARTLDTLHTYCNFYNGWFGIHHTGPWFSVPL